jgi:hypothetical protein
VPIISSIIGGIAAAAGVGGVVEGAQAGGRQQKALSIQEQIAQQEEADRQKVFNQLQPFFSQYLQAGSPFLNLIQSAAAGTEAQGANNAAGQIRQTVGSSGLGYGPSGTTAAALGEEGAQTAALSSSNYLQNLLNNEMVKFQAAQGLNTLGANSSSGQNQPNVSAQLPYQNLGGGLTGLSQIINGLTQNNNQQTQNVGNAPIGQLPLGNAPTIPLIPSVSGTPTTEGWSI